MVRLYVEGRAKPELLRTYSAERPAIAQGLIDFDKERSKIMASPPKDPSRPEIGGVDPQELQAYFVMSGRYTAGVATHYAPTTVLTAHPPISILLARPPSCADALGADGGSAGVHSGSQAQMWVAAMRTTLDLPDDVLRRAKIEAVERGSTLRQLVIDALQREIAGTSRPRKRLERPPLELAADAPLRRLSPENVKRLDAEDLRRSDERKARALHR
jgi:hypothetical protein